MKRWENCWSQLIAGVLFAILGVSSILTQHIGSATVWEMQANGPVAQFIGILLLIMAAMTLIDWVKKYKHHQR